MRVNLLAETDYNQKCNILFMLIKLLFNSNSTEKIVQQSSSMFVRLRQKTSTYAKTFVYSPTF